MTDKIVAGQVFVPSARVWNGMVDAAQDYIQSALGEGGRPRRTPYPTDCVVIKNTSGSNRSRGDAMEISGLQTSAIDPETLLVTGITPTAAGQPFAILKRPVPNNGFTIAQVSGVCLARINVSSAGHKYAKLAASTNTLVSGDDGPAQIVYKPGTGTNDCIVAIGAGIPAAAAVSNKLLIRFTLTAALATSDASKAATIQAQYGPGTASTDTGAGAITVNNLLTHTAGVYVFSGDSGDAGLAFWDSGSSYRILQMECP